MCYGGVCRTFSISEASPNMSNAAHEPPRYGAFTPPRVTPQDWCVVHASWRFESYYAYMEIFVKMFTCL